MMFPSPLGVKARRRTSRMQFAHDLPLPQGKGSPDMQALFLAISSFRKVTDVYPVLLLRILRMYCWRCLRHLLPSPAKLIVGHRGDPSSIPIIVGASVYLFTTLL